MTATIAAPPAVDTLGPLIAEYKQLAARIDLVLPKLVRAYVAVHYPGAAELVLEGDPWRFTVAGLRSADGAEAPASRDAVDDDELGYLARDLAADAVRSSDSGDAWVLALRAS